MGSWRGLGLLLLPALALASVHKHVDHQHWPDDYDPLFRKYTKHYFGPHFDWRWFKAQGIAESGLDPDASSPAGAVGIMQILPSTYREISEDNPHLSDITDPRWNIAAGIYYDRQLYRKWKRNEVPIGERLYFAFGSYNAGYRNMLRAYQRAAEQHRTVREWAQVAPHSPRETRHYVDRISRLMQQEPEA
ncbi:MAG: transglycosylase SLT domain-containing protein [Gammaproteobacteria bacterium]|jgi:soluble lytic murein transglycosylase-like protein